MVSNASEDLPEPDSPVMTTSWSRGISMSMFLRLCSRAPRTWMEPAIQKSPGTRIVFLSCSIIWTRPAAMGSLGLSPGRVVRRWTAYVGPIGLGSSPGHPGEHHPVLVFPHEHGE